MTSPIARAIVGISTALILAVSVPVLAATPERHPTQVPRHVERTRITAQQADQIALRKFPGARVVGTTQLVREGKTMVFRVHLREGKMRRTVTINALDGKIMSTKGAERQRAHQR